MTLLSEALGLLCLALSQSASATWRLSEEEAVLELYREALETA